MTDALKPCPFCGSTAIDFFEGKVGGSYATAMCRVCHMTGPEGDTMEEAAVLWNRRTDQPPEAPSAAQLHPE